MKKRELAAILSAHADGLIIGKDQSAQLLSDYPEEAAELKPLFHLAAAIQTALVPIKAPVAFVNRLRSDLMAHTPPEITVKAPISAQRILLMGVAAAGSVLSVTGIALLIWRRLKPTGKPDQQPAAAI